MSVAIEKGSEVVRLLVMAGLCGRFLKDGDGARRLVVSGHCDGDILLRDQVDRGNLVAFFLGVLESLVEIVELALVFAKAEGGDGTGAGGEVQRPNILLGD